MKVASRQHYLKDWRFVQMIVVIYASSDNILSLNIKKGRATKGALYPQWFVGHNGFMVSLKLCLILWEFNLQSKGMVKVKLRFSAPSAGIAEIEQT